MPALQKYGLYRRLNDGKVEFISYCNEKIQNWIGVNKDELNALIDETLPKEN